MDLIQYTMQWTRGEILEAGLLGLFGLVLIMLGILGWRLGSSPNAKAMVIPLILLGILYSVMGISNILMNANRIGQYKQAHQEDPARFVKEEKKRVEGFEAIFKVTYPLATVFILGGMVLFLFLGGPHTKAIGFSLIMLGLSTYVIDHFAAERADVYYQHITRLSLEADPG